MRVLINGLAALKPKTGVGHHLAQLAGALAAGFPEDTFALYPGERLAGLVRRLNRPSAPASANRTLTLAACGYAAAKATAKAASQLHFTAYRRAFRFDLYHEPNFVPFRCGLPMVVTVHDLSVLRFPQWHPADRVRAHERHFRRGLGRAAHVIVVSESVRRELMHDLGLPPHRVTAIHNGLSAAFRPHSPEEIVPIRARLGLPSRYFLCVGTVEPRKNVGTVMRAFADLPAPVRDDCPLVLVGPWGWKSEPERDYFERIGRASGIRHLGYVADGDLPAVYAGAVGLVYPSHYEGFGLPPVEMLASGGAVLASTADAIREVCDTHAAFLEPEDIPAWRTALLRLATDAEYREQLQRGGVEHAARFTWERAAAETIAVYRSVLGPAPTAPLASRSAA